MNRTGLIPVCCSHAKPWIVKDDMIYELRPDGSMVRVAPVSAYDIEVGRTDDVRDSDVLLRCDPVLPYTWEPPANCEDGVLAEVARILEGVR